jgi:hypothetical protein
MLLGGFMAVQEPMVRAYEELCNKGTLSNLPDDDLLRAADALVEALKRPRLQPSPTTETSGPAKPVARKPSSRTEI